MFGARARRTSAEAAALPAISHSEFRVPHSYDPPRNSQKRPAERDSHEPHRGRIGWGARPPRAQPTTPSSLAWRRPRANRFACPPAKCSARGRAEPQPRRLRSPPFRTPNSAFRIPMIPREILKNVLQSEIRTNRIAAELAGERARLGRSQRRPRRWLGVARVQTDSLVPRPNVRREGAPNRSRGGCAPRHFALRIPR